MRRKEFEGCRLGIVVQFVREPPCQGGSCGFKSSQSRPMIRERYINSFLPGEKELDLTSQPSFVPHFSSDKESQGMVKSNIPVLSESLLPGRCNQYTNTVLSTATTKGDALRNWIKKGGMPFYSDFSLELINLSIGHRFLSQTILDFRSGRWVWGEGWVRLQNQMRPITNARLIRMVWWLVTSTQYKQRDWSQKKKIQ